MKQENLRKEILGKVEEFYKSGHGTSPFVPGETPIPYSGRKYDADEMMHLVDASLDFWLTEGRFAEKFEKELCSYIGSRAVLLANSGSSANLLAISALTSDKLGDRRLKPGDEVITVAAGFPTTINPIVQNQLIPVFCDIETETNNVKLEDLERATSPKTKAIILAHTLGNPFNLDAVKQIAEKNNLWLIEDNCDALGSTYKGKMTGSFGDLSTLSFYPPHHITMGEGGAVLVNRPELKKLVESFRDWGRDCWCDPGKDNTCGKRFDYQLGDLPHGYDHKYVFSHIGYNFKVTDMQAAVGVAQLKKLPSFVAKRRENWKALRDGLSELEEFFILPQATPHTDPSWFGFLLTIRFGAPFNRSQILNHLNEKKIATRLLFAGNITRQPAYKDVCYRVVHSLENSDLIMNKAFWVGVSPGILPEMIQFMIDQIKSFVRGVK